MAELYPATGGHISPEALWEIERLEEANAPLAPAPARAATSTPTGKPRAQPNCRRPPSRQLPCKQPAHQTPN
eukprot:3432773-Pyramimonas_sp.AAC.1